MKLKYKKTDHRKVGYWRERGYALYDSVPRGFFVFEQTTMPSPDGYRWYWNKKSMFSRDPKSKFKRLLVRIRKK